MLDAINTYDKFGYTETGCFVREPKGDYVPYIHYDDVIKCIKNEPPVTPKEKTGKWIIKDGKEQGYDIAGVKTWYIQIMCDKCGFIKPAIEGHTGQYHFCPNCGVKMFEPQESEVSDERKSNRRK